MTLALARVIIGADSAYRVNAFVNIKFVLL